MAIDAGVVIPVPVQQGRQVCGSSRKILDMEGHVLNEAGGSLLSKAAHRRENAGADGPVLSHFLGVRREADFYIERLEGIGNSLYLLLQSFRCLGLGFRKHGGKVRDIGLQVRIVHGGKAALVQQFGGRDGIGFHSHHGLGGRHNVREVNHGAGLVRSDGQRVHSYFGQEGQGAFGAHHQVRQHLERVFVRHQRAQVQAGYVLDAIFVLDAPGQLFIGLYLFMEFLQAFHNLGVAFPESVAGSFRASVQEGSVGQYYLGAHQHLVGVGMRTAAHTGGIVGHNSAHHTAANGSRIRAEVPSKGGQMLVYLGSYYDGGIGMVLPFLPVLAGYQQDAVCYGLSGKRGARSAEGDGKTHPGSQFQDLGYFLFIGGPQNHLGRHFVFAGVGSPGQGTEFVGIDSVGRQNAFYRLMKSRHHSVSSVYCWSKMVLSLSVSWIMLLSSARGTSLGEPLMRSLR